ncbi:phage tail tape measure protein [Cereibacter azotoformans]|uniref:phage tail tape measure protein n=1 Tax=Cereibacter azotoformans TaxID=43057 RepID=UPI0015D5DC41|nr:phage tail tape measure protein [Cereibacter azotoformans]
MQDAARGAGGGAFERANARLGQAIEQNNAALDRARAGMVDAVGGAFALRAALGAPLGAARTFETALEDIGQKAGVPQEKLAALGDQILEISERTNRGAAEVAASVDALAGRGASLDVAMVAAEPINKAATAYRASAEDLAAASWAAVDNLRVPADQIATVLDMMAEAGKQGAFELRDMATYFPALGAAYQGLGQSGTGAVADLAAALQVVRKGTGDASTAATNLANVLQKIYAPATVRRFAERGVDVFAEMEAAAKRGLTPIEAIAELTEKTLGGDLSKLGDLFEDAQVQAGMRSLIQNMDEYRRIRQGAMQADGVVDADFDRRLNTAAGAIDRWAATVERLNITIGQSLVPLLNQLLSRITPVIDAAREFARVNPVLTRTLITAAAGLVAFRVAVAGIRFVGLLGKGGALDLLALGMNTVGRAGVRLGGAAAQAVALQTALGAMSGGAALSTLSKLGIGLRAAVMAVPGVGALGSALTAIGAGIATISAPVWGTFAAIAVAVAAAGFAIYKYWDRITATMSGVGQAIGEILAPAVEAVRPSLEWMAPIGEKIAAGWEKAKSALAAVGEWLGGFFQREILGEEARAAAERDGYDFVMSLWNGMKNVMADLTAWVTEKAAAILQPFSDLKTAVGGWFGIGDGGDAPGGTAPSVAGARAGGGPVSPGETYLVGEEGPELITPSRGGYVHPNGRGPAMGGAGPMSVNVSNSFSITGQTDPRAIAEQVAAAIEDAVNGALRRVMADTGVDA